jgi:hypothetical protein
VKPLSVGKDERDHGDFATLGIPSPAGKKHAMKIPMGQRWDTNHEGLRQIFCAALTGICANPHFLDTHQFQGEPAAAVEFADKIVMEALKASGAIALTPQDTKVAP